MSANYTSCISAHPPLLNAPSVFALVLNFCLLKYIYITLIKL